MIRRAGKVAVLAVLVGAATASPASASASAAWRGVVIAKDPARQAVVTASAHGVVRTLRVGSAVRGVGLGRVLSVHAQRLRDGTYRSRGLAVAGRATKARLRGVLIRHQRALGRYLVSAGGSVLTVRSANVRRTASFTRERPGDRVVMSLSLTGTTATATSVQTVGHTGSTQLAGIFLGFTPEGTIRLAVAGKGEVLVSVPAGTALPALSPGKELSLHVSVDAAGAFTLAGAGGTTDVGAGEEANDDVNGTDDDADDTAGEVATGAAGAGSVDGANAGDDESVDDNSASSDVESADDDGGTRDGGDEGGGGDGGDD